VADAGVRTHDRLFFHRNPPFIIQTMKLTIHPLLVFAALASVVSPEIRALPDAEAAAGRLVFRKYADAVVVVKLSINMKVTMGDRAMPPNEYKVDVNGTIIETSGLTVTSLSAIDARVIFDAMRAQLAPPNVPVELTQSELKGVRLRLADGTEVPAKVVWKDAVHDVALLAPEDSAAAARRAFTWVNLHEAPEAAMLLGNYYHLSRLNDAMQRIPQMRPCTITSIVERPRRLLLITTDGFSDALGCPVFDAQGRVLGICLRYMADGAIKGTVVVPSADIADIVGLAASSK
jgi:hypothetical protein